MADPRTVYYEGLVQSSTPAASQGLAVTISSGEVTPAATGAGDGIIENIGTGLEGSAVKVVASGPTKGLVSATVTAGMKLTADASGGQLEEATGTEVVVCECLSDGVSGNLVDVCVVPGLQHAGS